MERMGIDVDKTRQAGRGADDSAGSTTRLSRRRALEILADVAVRNVGGLVVPLDDVCDDQLFDHWTNAEDMHFHFDLEQSLAAFKAIRLDPEGARDLHLVGLDARDDDDVRALLLFVVTRFLLVGKTGSTKCLLEWAGYVTQRHMPDSPKDLVAFVDLFENHPLLEAQLVVETAVEVLIEVDMVEELVCWQVDCVFHANLHLSSQAMACCLRISAVQDGHARELVPTLVILL